MVMSEREARGVLNLSDGESVVQMFTAIISLHRDGAGMGEIREFLKKSFILNLHSVPGYRLTSPSYQNQMHFVRKGDS